MGTVVSTIVDLFLTRIADWQLNEIFVNSGSMVLNEYCEPWVRSAVVEFSPECNQTLSYIVTSGSAEGYFTEDLNEENQIILSRLVTKYWLEKQIKDRLQMSNFVTDRDLKTYSAAQNLKSKQDYYNVIVEELDTLLNRYAYRNNDWSDWQSQNFDHGVST